MAIGEYIFLGGEDLALGVCVSGEELLVVWVLVWGYFGVNVVFGGCGFGVGVWREGFAHRFIDVLAWSHVDSIRRKEVVRLFVLQRRILSWGIKENFPSLGSLCPICLCPEIVSFHVWIHNVHCRSVACFIFPTASL